MSATDWVWVWLGAAVFFGFGELVTPFLFFSALALLVFVPIGHRLARGGPVDEAAEGATRWVGRIAVVLEDIPDGPHSTGLVRLERTQWRAETDAGTAIPAGAQVEVLAVRGTRLVVAPPTPT